MVYSTQQTPSPRESTTKKSGKPAKKLVLQDLKKNSSPDILRADKKSRQSMLQSGSLKKETLKLKKHEKLMRSTMQITKVRAADEIISGQTSVLGSKSSLKNRQYQISRQMPQRKSLLSRLQQSVISRPSRILNQFQSTDSNNNSKSHSILHQIQNESVFQNHLYKSNLGSIGPPTNSTATEINEDLRSIDIHIDDYKNSVTSSASKDRFAQSTTLFEKYTTQPLKYPTSIPTLASGKKNPPKQLITSVNAPKSSVKDDFENEQSQQYKSAERIHSLLDISKYPLPQETKSKKAALVSFLHNVLGNSDRIDAEALQPLAPLLVQNSSTVIRELPNHLYKGINSTLQRKKIKQLSPQYFTQHLLSQQHEEYGSRIANITSQFASFDAKRSSIPPPINSVEVVKQEQQQKSQVEEEKDKSKSLAMKKEKDQAKDEQAKPTDILEVGGSKVKKPKTLSEEQEIIQDLEQRFQKQCDDLLGSISPSQGGDTKREQVDNDNGGETPRSEEYENDWAQECPVASLGQDIIVEVGSHQFSQTAQVEIAGSLMSSPQPRKTMIAKVLPNMDHLPEEPIYHKPQTQHMAFTQTKAQWMSSSYQPAQSKGSRVPLLKPKHLASFYQQNKDSATSHNRSSLPASISNSHRQNLDLDLALYASERMNTANTTDQQPRIYRQQHQQLPQHQFEMPLPPLQYSIKFVNKHIQQAMQKKQHQQSQQKQQQQLTSYSTISQPQHIFLMKPQ